MRVITNNVLIRLAKNDLRVGKQQIKYYFKEIGHASFT